MKLRFLLLRSFGDPTKKRPRFMPSFAGSAYVSSKVSWALQSRAGNQYDLRSRLIIEKDESQESFSQVRQKLHQKNCLKR